MWYHDAWTYSGILLCSKTATDGNACALPACAVYAFRAIREMFRNSTRARPPMAGVASAGRLLRLILSRKIYLTTPDPAAQLASLFADVTAMSRNLQHLRGRTDIAQTREKSV